MCLLSIATELVAITSSTSQEALIDTICVVFLVQVVEIPASFQHSPLLCILMCLQPSLAAVSIYYQYLLFGADINVTLG